MTSAAREVLEDCRGALLELADGVRGREWRRRWVVSVVLLRVVGHVLDKIDSSQSASYRVAISTWWRALKATKPHPEIFWHFIEDERNNILKEYLTNAGQGVTVQLSGVGINLATGEQKADPPNPAIYHYKMNSGHYKDYDQRDLLAEAIAWWEQQLDAIDAASQTGP